MSSLFLLLGCAAALAVEVQSLAGVAADAEAARRGRAAAPTVNDDTLADRGPWPLSVQGFRYYSAIRIELTNLRVARPYLDRRLYDRSRAVGGLFELAPVLEAEPDVMAVLTRHRATAREYLRMDQAVLTATAYTSSQLPDPIRLHAMHWRNISFVFDNPALIREESRHWGVQWHDTDRFVARY